MKAFDRLELHMRRELANLKGASILVALSGGLDSVVLLALLRRLQREWNLRLTVAHIHHGQGSRVQKKWRDSAREFCRELAGDLPFVTSENCDAPLPSEEQLRKFRHAALESLRVQTATELVAFAHHQDDLFETRLIRLIRGTGLQGLPAMQVRRDFLWRPLLAISRSELQRYAQKNQLEWLEDPSNQDTRVLRNWVRREWLPLLEARRPGSSAAMARSLELIAESLKTSTASTKPTLEQSREDLALDRVTFKQLSQAEKRQTLAHYVHKMGFSNVSARHMNEIIKRLDTSRKRLTFDVANLQWHINAERVWAGPKGDERL